MTWNSKDELSKIPRKFQKPQRIRLFIWMVLKDPLLTNVKHARRGLGDNSAYGICDHNFEDFFHVIRDCSTAKAIWAQDSYGGGGLAMFVWYNCLIHLENRNLHMFQEVPWSIDEVFKSSLCWVKRFASLVLTGNWIQMYTDGTVKANFGFVTTGGVICDHNGKWILGFNRYLGMCLVLEAELWAIYDGLDLTLDQGHDKVLINTNSMEVVWAIQDMHSKDSNSTLIR
ncbi:hypothetical protein Gohar_003075 [Gossypium harknessii]|uniref:RNase H type-1 domain-containing protein n=1 Tax=Gossypium harknessii TaxID=34285 RepID=A0A7J9HMW3_9ROSI|nr:hypothetical protein [Gossypium harknessii]